MNTAAFIMNKLYIITSTYSSNLCGTLWPEAESASSSRSSWPDWPGLGEELLDAMRFGFQSLDLYDSNVPIFFGAWTPLIGEVCFELVVDWSIHFGSRLFPIFIDSKFSTNMADFWMLFCSKTNLGTKNASEKSRTLAITCPQLTKIELEGISFLPFFRTIQNGC